MSTPERAHTALTRLIAQTEPCMDAVGQMAINGGNWVREFRPTSRDALNVVSNNLLGPLGRLAASACPEAGTVNLEQVREAAAELLLEFAFIRGAANQTNPVQKDMLANG